jgi:hypothetical protein
MNNAIIQGEYVTFKHIKTRKAVVLEIEVAEEYFNKVINTLGMPIGGQSKPVAVALLDESVTKKTVSNSTGLEKTEGEKMVTQAVMYCKDEMFYNFLTSRYKAPATEGAAIAFIYGACDIKSRSELKDDTSAQIRFKELVEQFKDWKFENNYEDNLNREG